jgi:DNA-directed RNA polymerase specialized sigma24 family protein
MRDPDAFDEFYKSTRLRLLLQTYALTGDLGASRHAVRDAFVLAWHHWRKVERLDDPETAVRPDAWRHAQRRHTARLWHREKGLDPEVKETFDILGQLTMRQRKALLLTQVAGVSIPQLAREIGVPLEEAEAELQHGVAEFTRLRDVPTVGIRAAFAPLERAVADTRFPRPSIIRRAGAARRRTHTTVGAIGAVALFLVSGALVTDAAGVRPSLDRAATGSQSPGADTDPPPPEVRLPETSLLTAAQLDSFLGDRAWTERRTHANTQGSRDILPCQREPYADPAGAEALVRTFSGTAAKQPRATAVQMTEASTSARAARRTYRTLVDWFAECSDARVQLIATRTVERVGDQAIQLVLRSWEAPVTTVVVGVARSGQFTTTTVDSVPTDGRPDVDASGRMLAAGVEGICGLDEGGGCASDRPALAFITPVPVGDAPALLSEIDLPPVSGVDRPWAGTEPARASANMAATRCENAAFTGTFRGARFSHSFTRTFVIPGADLPDEFGLTETVGALPARRATAFIEDVRSRLRGCAQRDLGTDVTAGPRSDQGDRSLTVWRLTTELSEKRSLTYSMAILRDGTSVAQLSFVEAPDVTMPPGTFEALALRALDRLGELPKPRRGG